MTAKLVRFDILRKVPKNILFCNNSLTAKSCYGGEKHRNPVGFYGRNSTKSTVNHKHNNHKHHHHGGAVCPSYGVGSMDTPDRTRRPDSSEKHIYCSIQKEWKNLFYSFSITSTFPQRTFDDLSITLDACGLSKCVALMVVVDESR